MTDHPKSTFARRVRGRPPPPGTNMGASNPSARGPASSAPASAHTPSSRSVPVQYSRPMALTIAHPILSFPGLPISITPTFMC